VCDKIARHAVLKAPRIVKILRLKEGQLAKTWKRKKDIPCADGKKKAPRCGRKRTGPCHINTYHSFRADNRAAGGEGAAIKMCKRELLPKKKGDFKKGCP